jgi:protein-tyrosine phosphatase
MIPVNNIVPKNILFVCSGNACRSPMADGLLKKLLADKGITDITVRSCGTAASEKYRVPPFVMALMTERGVDLGGHRSTQVTREMVDAAGLILVMDEQHLRYFSLYFPDAVSKVHLLKEYVGLGRKGREIFDPIGQPDEVYAAAAELIEKCIRKLLKKLEKKA